MTWKDIKKRIGRISLAILEYVIKCCAFVAALITVGSSGSLLEKVASGFGALPVVFQKLPSAVQHISEITAIVQDYNTQTMATFANSHGYDAISSLMLGLNDVVLYFTAINQNFSEAALSTLAATAIVFFSFFFVGWVLRITRRKGKDFLGAKVEKLLWNKLFETSQPNQDTPKVSAPVQEKSEPEVTTEDVDESPDMDEQWSDPTVFQGEDEEEDEESKPKHSLKLVEKSEHKEEESAHFEDYHETPQNGHVQEYADSGSDENQEEETDEKSETGLMSTLDLEDPEEVETESEAESGINDSEEIPRLDSEEGNKRPDDNHDSSSLENELSEELTRVQEDKENSNGAEQKQIKYQNNSLNEFLEMARSSSG